uniref:Adenosine deaminase n=1 Tax=Macrostomum lignano TaxID=282301 RepID=A0A1I8G2X6_9PLAT
RLPVEFSYSVERRECQQTARVHPHPNPNPESDLHRVELHCHFEGALRPSTVFNIAKRRGHKLPVATPEEFAEFMRRKEPSLLREFLSYFPVLMSFVAGDPDGIVQLAVDFIEDCAKNKIAYIESSCSPKTPSLPRTGCRLCCEDSSWARNEFCDETLRLAKAYANHGVVGIDVAGDDKEDYDSERGGTHPDIVRLFQEAYKAGIHRTAHAGENSGAEMVTEALDSLHAERIGHGYHTLDNPTLYQRILHDRVHLETCPLSSHLTSAVLTDWPHHPIQRLAADKANYSINTDDPTLTGQWLDAEYRMCLDRIGLPPWELVRTNYCAARSSFLPEEEKADLIAQLDAYYRVRL